jgi:hypothetical protein
MRHYWDEQFQNRVEQSQERFFNVKKNIILRRVKKTTVRAVCRVLSGDDLVNKTVLPIDDVNIFFDYGVFKGVCDKRYHTDNFKSYFIFGGYVYAKLGYYISIWT